MCDKIQTDEVERGRGYFRKGNREVTEMPILFAPCQCGDRWYARYDGNTVWVEAIKDEMPIGLDEIKTFEDEI